MDEGPRGSRDRFQVRLWDLIVLVVGASYVLDVARRSKVAWGGGLPDLAHAVGLTVLTLGVGVGLVVAGRWFRGPRGRESRAWGLFWRVVAMGWLAGSLVEVAAALQDADATPAPLPFGNQATMRLRLATLMATLGMVGLVLGSAPLGTRPPGSTPKPRPRWGSWPAVALATVVGVAVLGLGHGLLPYLLLLALEAVWNSLNRAPLVPRAGLFDRQMMASLEALPGLVGCVLTAVWVDDDLRGAARDPVGARAPRSWGGMIARSATAALAASGSAYVVLISIPKLDPYLAEGLATMVDSSTIATVTLGFAALAAGLSARSAAHLWAGVGTGSDDRPAGRESPPRRLGPWPRRIIGGLVGLTSLEITAAAVQAIRRDLESRWYIPIGLDRWSSIIQATADWLGSSKGSSGWRIPLDRPDDFLIGIAAVWLTIRLAGLVAPKHPGRPSPLDAIGADRLALGRFLGWWVGLTTLMLASLPGLALLGLALIHFAIRWAAG